MRNKCNALELSPNYRPPIICGKIVFHETSPWCQKGWGLLQVYINSTQIMIHKLAASPLPGRLLQTQILRPPRHTESGVQPRYMAFTTWLQVTLCL